MHLQVAQLGAEFTASPGEIGEARALYDRVHCLQLPGFIEPCLLATIQERLPEATTSNVEYDGVGTEVRLAFGASTAALDLALNDETLFEAIRQLTGVGAIGYFGGRVYRMTSEGHGFGWHDDNEDNRLIGLSLNLGGASFRGGLLQIWDDTTKAIVCEVANVEPGSAVIFRIGPAVMHRVTPVEGPVPKVAYSGWFRSKPSYREFMRQRWSRVAAANSAAGL